MAPTKVDLTPRRHHGYSVILFIFGTLFPPLAVAARFGIGSDFWLNLLLTICGYIPGHVHNFYIQNIRNNKNHRRTPKWIQKYGLVDTSTIKRHERRSQWANRYDERLPQSALNDQPLEEGQEGGSSIDLSVEGERQRNGGGEFWNPNEEQFYGQPDRSSATVRSNGSGGRWKYPANFEDTIEEPAGSRKKSKKKKEKKDRWERTEDAYSIGEAGTTSKRKKSKKRKTTIDAEAYSRRSSSTNEFPEDAEGGLYGNGTRPSAAPEGSRTGADDIFSHEF